MKRSNEIIFLRQRDSVKYQGGQQIQTLKFQYIPVNFSSTFCNIPVQNMLYRLSNININTVSKGKI